MHDEIKQFSKSHKNWFERERNNVRVWARLNDVINELIDDFACYLASMVECHSISLTKVNFFDFI